MRRCLRCDRPASGDDFETLRCDSCGDQGVAFYRGPRPAWPPVLVARKDGEPEPVATFGAFLLGPVPRAPRLSLSLGGGA